MISIKKNLIIFIVLFAFFLFALYPEQPLHRVSNIAHRGASYYEVDHSFAAYDLALSHKADYLELDVQMTKDGVVVVEHDESPPYAKGRMISSYSYKELASLERKNDKGSTPILTLREVIARYGTYPLYIETKNRRPGIEQALIDVLVESGRINDPQTLLFQSKSEESLRILKRRFPSIPTMKIFSKVESENLTVDDLRKVKQYADGIIVNYKTFPIDLISIAHEEKLYVHTYTVNSKSDMKRLIQLGVDGIITDRPDVLRKLYK
ncbi:glycerophosphodiester phosphodiesterase family protein [Lysinibacillus sp. 54212]|uniref:glycerophosphodiester phosphodiesterase family protein n=1 Tax=Lysinibacillus sp. 54212 TaxID=3119829 RepID=UPI002FCBB9DC